MLVSCIEGREEANLGYKTMRDSVSFSNTVKHAKKKSKITISHLLVNIIPMLTYVGNKEWKQRDRKCINTAIYSRPIYM